MLHNTIGTMVVPKNTMSFFFPARVLRNFNTKSGLLKTTKSGLHPVSPRNNIWTTPLLKDHSVVPSTRSCPYSTSSEESSSFSSNYKKFSTDFNERGTHTPYNPTKNTRPYKPRKSSGKPLSIGSVVAYPSHTNSRGPRIRSTIDTKHRPSHPRSAQATKTLAANAANPDLDSASIQEDGDHVEPISESTQIFVDSMQEANIPLVRNRPPVFVCSTYEQAETAMELFTAYRSAVNKSLDPVGFDTETTTSFVPRTGSGVSLVQIATHDVCLIFQVFRITKNNTQKNLFPPQLKAFLEDPEKKLIGVATIGDGKALRSSYGINCEGIISLDQLAKEKGILAHSLASLDEMYGRPGREVVKTKSMLGWNWDKDGLDPRWVWYAAKDAFAGLAIYENMLNDNRKEGFKPYDKKFPMSDEQIAIDISKLMTERYSNRGSKRFPNELFRIPVGAAQKFLAHNYRRFQLSYQPAERMEQSMRYIQMLLKNGKLHLVGDKNPSDALESTDIICLPGQSWATILPTSKGIDIISPYFNGKRVDPSELAERFISINDVNDENDVVDQDVADMKLFLELSWVWDIPRRPSALVGLYGNALANARHLKKSEAIKNEITDKDPEDGNVVKRTPEKIATDRQEANEFWMSYQQRLVQRNIVRLYNGMVEINPSIESQIFNIVQSSGKSPLKESSSTVNSLGPDTINNNADTAKSEEPGTINNNADTAKSRESLHE